jgi:hypothetical protein
VRSRGPGTIPPAQKDPENDEAGWQAVTIASDHVDLDHGLLMRRGLLSAQVVTALASRVERDVCSQARGRRRRAAPGSAGLSDAGEPRSSAYCELGPIGARRVSAGLLRVEQKSKKAFGTSAVFNRPKND